jgi:hypothetical protein
MKRLNFIATLLMLYMSLGTANAQQYPVDISAEVNSNWCPDVGNCSTFPFGTQKYDGVTFNIPGSATTSNVWEAYTAAGGGSGQVSVTIPVNIANVRTVYTLMNTNWGSAQTGLLAVTFTGTNGATWTYTPLGNVDIRDYNQDGFTNSIACRLPGGVHQAGTVNAWTNGQGQRLDMQIFELPASFKGQTLSSVTITDNGASGVQRSFLAAVTVSTRVP